MKKITKDDLRPITRPILASLMEIACEAAAQVKADHRRLRCRHRGVDVHSNFCGACGALISIESAIGMLPVFGAAFTMQQILVGNAIVKAQLAGAKNSSNNRLGNTWAK